MNELEPVRIRLDDPVAVDDEPDAGPLVATRSVSGHLDHGIQASEALRRARLRGEEEVPHPADGFPLRCEPGLARWVPCR